MARKLAATIAFFTLISIFTPTSAHADVKKFSTIKCRTAKATAQSPLKVNPPTTLLKRGPRIITVTTNCGDIVIQPDFKAAPITLTVLSTLMTAGFYNKTFCHRITNQGIYILQCGDPTGTGAGDPGFRYSDENLPKPGEDNYPEGTVAMANSGPGTNGSQFFIVYDDTTLGPNYTIWGKVTSGLDIVRYIAAGGVRGGGGDGQPLRTIVIERISVRS
jgi:peptidyl-prolyl cis-trans isomerase B (cyclophilin B)